MASRGHRVIDDRPGARAHRLQKPPLGVVLEVLDRHRGRRIADERVKPAVLLSDGREQAFRVIAAGDIRLDNQRLSAPMAVNCSFSSSSAALPHL